MWSTGVGPVGSLVAQGVFEEGETVILADFRDATDGNLGDVVTEALRVDLQESPVLELLPPTYVQDAMGRMGRTEDAPFTAEVARELAVRDGFKAVVQGEVAGVGSGYLLTASLVAAESGEVLKAFRVPVDSEDELLDGIDKLSQDIREKSGESLRSIRGGTPLEEATTASLEALRLYSRAEESFSQGRGLEAIPLLEEALALDPEFAMAWRKLAVILSNSGMEPDRTREATVRAYELRRRLTDREAGLAEAWYYSNVEDNPERAVETYRRILERHPNDITALNNTGVRLFLMGRYAEAEEPLRRLMDTPAPGSVMFSNYIQVLWNVGRFDEAWSWLDSLRATHSESPAVGRLHHWLLAGEGRWTQAHDIAVRHVEENPSLVGNQVYGRSDIAGYDLGRGRWDESAQHRDRAWRTALNERVYDLFYQGPGYQELVASYALGSREDAVAAADRALAALPLDSLSDRHPQRVVFAQFLAAAGDLERADAIFDAYQEAVPPEAQGRNFRRIAQEYRAFRARGEGDDGASAAAFDRLYTEMIPCGDVCVWSAEWGLALEGAGRVDEALEKYELHRQGRLPLSWHAYLNVWTPVVLERIGAIHEDRGDTEAAAEAYRELVDAYAGGDGPFVPYVERARSRLAALGG